MTITNPSPTFPQFPGDAAAVTLSDTARFAPSVIYACTAGDVTVVTSQGNTVLFTAVPVGAVIPVRVIGVKTTGTASGATLVRIF